MKPPAPGAVDWNLCTYEGAEREQLRRWSHLTLREKLSAVEQMGEWAERTRAGREAAGLPYFDPQTDELVRPVAKQAR